MVTGDDVDDMLGLEDRMVDQFLGMRVNEAVIGAIAVLAGLDDPRPPQFRQVLGNRGRRIADRAGEFTDLPLVCSQSQDDSDPRRVGQQRKTSAARSTYSLST